MEVVNDIAMIRKLRWADPSLSWGLVPTMGYLHAGHVALVEQARQENDRIAATIFVNPTQFAAGEDLESYPRNLKGDLELLESAGTDLVFIPTNEVMYPPEFQTKVIVEGVSTLLEGRSRPTHFQGVTTVVAKLFNIVQPTRAYFGQKDAQQTVVIRRMVTDLNMNLAIIICPTVREADGLAMSSRNTYLTAEQRAAAPVLFRALMQADTAFRQGERSGSVLRNLMETVISQEVCARIDYVSVADPLTLQELEVIDTAVLFSLAVFFGDTRLIDNVLIGN